MDWSNFDDSYGRLKNVLRALMGNGKDDHKLDVYGSYRNYEREIKIIVERIEEETLEYVKSFREISEIAQREEEPDDELLDKLLKCHSLIRLDIKSFIIFTRIFIDTLAKIVTLCFGDKAKHLPQTMTTLLKDAKFLTLDPDFAEGFRNKMSWVTALVENRVEIEHCLGSIRWYTPEEGKFGFSIRGSRTRKNRELLGTDRIESITKYMKEILSNLSEVISFIYIKFNFLP